MVDQKLMDYFGFDQADLAANRLGQFTDRQRLRLVKEDKGHRSGSMLGAIFYALLAVLGLAIAWPNALRDPSKGFDLELALSFGVAWPLFFGYMSVSQVRSALGQHSLSLAKVRGEVNIVRKETEATSEHTSHVYHELHIGGKEFEVEEDIADVLMQGKQYVLYYLGGTNEILSAEQVSGGS